MLYLKVKGKWYRTKFRGHNDLSFFVRDLVDMTYSDRTNTFVRRMQDDELNPDIILLEIWMQGPETLPYFNEDEFIKMFQNEQLST